MASSELHLPLPFELVEEILYRTPAESLLRFKATCKKWYALITNKKFIYRHLNHSPERFIKPAETVQIMDPITGIRSDSPVPDELQILYNPDSSSRGYFPITIMVHCDGLMLFFCNDLNRGMNHMLAIWNPVLRQIKWIEPSGHYTSSDYYGFGYDKISRGDYKVLRFTGQDGGRFEPEVEIYEFKTGFWRTLEEDLDGWDVDWKSRGVSVTVMGDTYWIFEKLEEYVVRKFDFSSETFKDVCDCPFLFQLRLLSCFEGDRLSLLQQVGSSGEIEVWITNKLSDAEVSLIKYFSVAGPHLPELHGMALPVYVTGKHKTIRAWCEECKEYDDEASDKYYISMTLYEIDQGGIRKQIETQRQYYGYIGFTSYICAYRYVPSLIPLPG